jgi:hypothetical protein
LPQEGKKQMLRGGDLQWYRILAAVGSSNLRLLNIGYVGNGGGQDGALPVGWDATEKVIRIKLYGGICGKKDWWTVCPVI